MKYISLVLALCLQVVMAEETPTAPVAASKAEFVFPDFSQCYEKNKQSVVYFGSTRAVAVSEKQAVAYSKEKPSVPFVRSDYLAHLYLFDSQKPLVPIKLKSTAELKPGEWLESLTDTSLVVVNASKVGNPTREFFEFNGKGQINSIVGGLCCEMYGLGIGEQYFIASEVLDNFINGKSASFIEIGARLTQTNDGLVVDALDPAVKETKLKVGDAVLSINGITVKTIAELQEALKGAKDSSKIMAQVKHENNTFEANIAAKAVAKASVPKKVPLPEVKKEGYLQKKGFKFDRDLKITEIARGSFAEQSGLKVGDRLMQVDTTPVEKVPEADAYLSKMTAGEHHLLFDRDDFQFFVTIKR